MNGFWLQMSLKSNHTEKESLKNNIFRSLISLVVLSNKIAKAKKKHTFPVHFSISIFMGSHCDISDDFVLKKNSQWFFILKKVFRASRSISLSFIDLNWITLLFLCYWSIFLLLIEEISFGEKNGKLNFNETFFCARFVMKSQF